MNLDEIRRRIDKLDTDLKVIGEIKVPVQHCLIAPEGSKLEYLRVVLKSLEDSAIAFKMLGCYPKA